MVVIDFMFFVYFFIDKKVFFIVEVWLEVVKYGIICNLFYDDMCWLDVGKLEVLQCVEKEF